jgi:hypothetical protein
MARTKKSDFGVRRLPSGKYQGRYDAPNGSRRSAGTFDTQSAALKAAKAKSVEVDSGTWRERAAAQSFRTYAEREVRIRDVGESTKRNYRSLLAGPLSFSDDRTLDGITAADVKVWWNIQSAKPVNRRNAYFLLRSVLASAVADDLIVKTPCLIKDAGKDVAAPRPGWTTAEFRLVLHHMPTTLHAALDVLFASHARLGELVGLNVEDYDRATGIPCMERDLPLSLIDSDACHQYPQRMAPRPIDEADLLRALAVGEIRENRFIEAKGQTPKTEGARKEAGRDLASFGIEGGAIVYGIAEVEDRLVAQPIPLAGESERMEGVAANRIEPALPIRVFEFPTAADPSIGYLWIEIAPSPLAPHMVDGVYWARAETTKRRLGDAEVVLLHSRREGIEERITAAVVEEARRAPQPPSLGPVMHLVAVPIAGRSDLASTYIKQDPMILNDLTTDIENAVPKDIQEQVFYTSSAVRRLDAIARTTLPTNRTGMDEIARHYATEIEIHKSGAVRLLASSIWFSDAGAGNPRAFLLDGTVVAWGYRLLALARRVGEACGYGGPWGFGVIITGLSDVPAAPRANGFRHRDQVIEAGSYERASVASGAEVEHSPGVVVGRLLADLMLALGTLRDYEEHFNPPTPEEPVVPNVG